MWLIHRVLKQFVVLPEDGLPVVERLAVGVFAVKNFNLADAALVDAIHIFTNVLPTETPWGKDVLA